MQSDPIYTRFELPGAVPSKKNSKRQVWARGKPLLLPSKSHEEWLHSAAKLLPKNLALYPPYSVKISYQAGTFHRKDLTNLAESIMDCLVAQGILQDDNYWALPTVILERLPFVQGSAFALVEIQSSPVPKTWESLLEQEKQAAAVRRKQAAKAKRKPN